jgi:hypothetical protein
MWLREITQVIPQRTQDTLQAQVADAAGVAPTARTLTWQQELDRSNPIEALRIFVSFMTDVNAATINADGYLAALVDRVEFSRNGVAGRGKVLVVDAAAVDIAQLNAHNNALDAATWSVANAAPTVDTAYTVCFDVPIAHPQIDDPLFSHTLCPVHLDTANPTLKLTFPAQATADTNGTPTLKFRYLNVEVHIVRREMTPDATKAVLDAGGFLEADIVSREFTMAQAGPQRMKIESPGEYSQLLMTLFTSSTARGDVTDSSIKEWKLTQQGITRREFTIPGLRSLNDKSRVHVGTTPFANQVLLDFLRDQSGAPDNNLGTLLNADIAENSGQETLIEFKGGSSTARIRTCGHRFLTPIGSRRFAFGK